MGIREELLHPPQTPTTRGSCLFPCSVPSGSFTPSLQRKCYLEYHYYQRQDKRCFPQWGNVLANREVTAPRDAVCEVPPQEQNHTEKCKGYAESTLYGKEKVGQEASPAD